MQWFVKSFLTFCHFWIKVPLLSFIITFWFAEIILSIVRSSTKFIPLVTSMSIVIVSLLTIIMKVLLAIYLSVLVANLLWDTLVSTVFIILMDFLFKIRMTLLVIMFSVKAGRPIKEKISIAAEVTVWITWSIQIWSSAMEVVLVLHLNYELNFKVIAMALNCLF